MIISGNYIYKKRDKMNLEYKLDDMFEKQLNFQVKARNYPFKDIKDKQQFINIMTLAAIDELLEALHNTQWKPWKNNQVFDNDEFKKELIDVWHFLINLSIAAGLDADYLYKEFLDKNNINFKRQKDGY